MSVPRLRMLARAAESVRVESLANGDLRVRIIYREPPVESGFPPVGVLTRLAIADEVQELLLDRIRKCQAGSK